jgi:hypothetical protein
VGVSFQYIPCHPVTRVQLAPALNFSAVSWTDTRNANGALTATITLPEAEYARAQLRPALEPDESAIYVKASNGTYPFGGVIVDQELDWAKGTGSIVVQEWRAWFYSVFLGPKVDLSDDVIYSWTAKDQLQIAREVIQYAVAGGSADGRPSIAYGTLTSGKLRDLNVKGTEFKYAGELMDSLAQRDGGFEWGIDIVDGPDRLPQLRLALDYPERGGAIDGLVFMQTQKTANIRPVGQIKRSSSERATRQWITGAAENNASAFAVDSDPSLPDGYTLLRERVTSYSSVTDRSTLASYARSERAFRTPKINTLDVEVSLSSPADILSYRSGDRGRLILRNGWYDIDLSNVRILSREINPLEDRAVLSLDLEDYELPDVDSEGSV